MPPYRSSCTQRTLSDRIRSSISPGCPLPHMPSLSMSVHAHGQGTRWPDQMALCLCLRTTGERLTTVVTHCDCAARSPVCPQPQHHGAWWLEGPQRRLSPDHEVHLSFPFVTKDDANVCLHTAVAGRLAFEFWPCCWLWGCDHFVCRNHELISSWNNLEVSGDISEPSNLLGLARSQAHFQMPSICLNNS